MTQMDDVWNAALDQALRTIDTNFLDASAECAGGSRSFERGHSSAAATATSLSRFLTFAVDFGAHGDESPLTNDTGALQ